MGIASYGNPDILLEKIKNFIWLDGLKINDGKYQCHWDTRLNLKEDRLFSVPRHLKVTDNPFQQFVGKYKREERIVCQSNRL